MLFKRFKVTDWYGEEYLFTPQKLYKRIFNNSLSDNWFTSATEIVKTCRTPDFPVEYGNAIMMLILNHFAEIEQDASSSKEIESSDNEAVNYCYNALYNISYSASNIRHKYLKAIIHNVAQNHFSMAEFNHKGETYSSLQEQWELSKFHEFNSEAILDFSLVRKSLHREYDETMRNAEKEGTFQRDDEKRMREISEFFQMFEKK